MTATRTRKKAGASIVAPDDFYRIIKFLGSRVFVEREPDLQALILVMLAGGNIHFDGGPGLAKSALVRELAWCVEGVADQGLYFETTLNADTKLEQVFGGLDVPHYTTTGEWRVNTKGKIYEALFGFVDEIARGPGWVLDGLLSLWNIGERQGIVDGTPLQCPLIFGASAANSKVDEDASGQFNALVDRITVIRYVDDIRSDDSFREMLRRSDDMLAHKAAGTWDGEREKLTLDQLLQAKREVAAVELTPAFEDALISVRRGAIRDGMNPSPRRWNEAKMLAKANAWLNGRSVTAEEDAAVLELVLPRDRSDEGPARTLVLPYLSKWEQEATAKRTEAAPIVADLEKLRPLVEGTPAGEEMDEDVMKLAMNVCARLDATKERIDAGVDKAASEQAQAPGLRALQDELEAWQSWAAQKNLPTMYGRNI